jgi:hypothetical protein
VSVGYLVSSSFFQKGGCAGFLFGILSADMLGEFGVLYGLNVLLILLVHSLVHYLVDGGR